MSRPTSYDRVCCPKAMISCHAQCRSTVCASQMRWWHATPDVIQPCVLSKGSDVMPRPTSSDCVCCPRAVMACHARRCRPCVISKAVMSCHARCCRPCALYKCGDVMPRLTSFDRLCYPKAIMACHARGRSTVCAAQRRLWHATPYVIRPSVLSKGGDCMSCPTSFDRVYCPKAVMACHALRCSTVFVVHGI